MTTTVPAELPISEARAILTDIATAAKEHHATTTLTKHGKPIAKVVHPDADEGELACLRNRVAALEANGAELLAELEAAREERDLAIAHDRQPYPTVWAHEQALKALETQRARAEKAEAELADIQEQRASWKIKHARSEDTRREAEAKLIEVAKVKVWTNEDGQRFVFADDLAAILLPDLNTPTPTTRTETA